MVMKIDVDRNTEVIIRYRKRAMFIGVMLWAVIILASIVGTILVNWTMIPLSIFGGFVLGFFIGRHTNQKIRKETGLELDEQQIIWKDAFYKK